MIAIMDDALKRLLDAEARAREVIDAASQERQHMLDERVGVGIDTIQIVKGSVNKLLCVSGIYFSPKGQIINGKEVEEKLVVVLFVGEVLQ